MAIKMLKILTKIKIFDSILTAIINNVFFLDTRFAEY